MSLIDDLISRILRPIIQRVLQFLGPFGKLISKVGDFFKKVLTLGPDLISLGQLIAGEIKAWRTFKEQIPYKTGVISLPAAVEKTADLLDQIRAGWAAIVDLAHEARAAFKGGAKDLDAEGLEADLTEQDAQGLAKLFPKLAKIGEKLLGGVAVILDLLDKITTFEKDFRAIVETEKQIREEIETGSTIFLQQKNARQTKRFQDGGSIKIRVGSLHPSA